MHRPQSTLCTRPAYHRLEEIESKTSFEIMMFLEDAGWTPTLPNFWGSPNGLLKASLGRTPDAPAMILRYFGQKLEEKQWGKAARKMGGRGLDLGGTVSFETARKAMQALQKKGQNVEATALSTAVVGGIWFAARNREERQQICSRCGVANDTPMHRYYRCHANRNLRDEEGCIAKTRWLDKFPDATLERYECLFTRGGAPGGTFAPWPHPRPLARDKDLGRHRFATRNRR